MTKTTGVGRGGYRPGSGLKPGAKNALKPKGETVMFSLSYSREDTARLLKAWQYDAPGTDFKEWLKAISKSAPLERAAIINGLYDEDEDLPIADQ